MDAVSRTAAPCPAWPRDGGHHPSVIGLREQHRRTASAFLTDNDQLGLAKELALGIPSITCMSRVSFDGPRSKIGIGRQGDSQPPRRRIHRMLSNDGIGPTFPSPRQAHAGADSQTARTTTTVNVRRVRFVLHTRRHQPRKQDGTSRPAFVAKWGNRVSIL
jgi:hypothetical protein